MLASQFCAKILIAMRLWPVKLAKKLLLRITYIQQISLQHQCIHQFTDEDISEAKDLLSQRMANLNDGARLKFLNQYANPVIQKSSSI